MFDTLPDLQDQSNVNSIEHRYSKLMRADVLHSQAAQVDASHPLATLTQKQLFHTCVWASSEDTHTKIMLLCIARFFNSDALTSSMSYAQVARECSMDERTSKKIARAIVGRWMTIERGKGHPTKSGRANLYRGLIPPDIFDRLRGALRPRKGVHQNHPLNDHKAKSTALVPQGVAPDHLMGWPTTTRTSINTHDERIGGLARKHGETSQLITEAQHPEAFRAWLNYQADPTMFRLWTKHRAASVPTLFPPSDEPIF